MHTVWQFSHVNITHVYVPHVNIGHVCAAHVYICTACDGCATQLGYHYIFCMFVEWSHNFKCQASARHAWLDPACLDPSLSSIRVMCAMQRLAIHLAAVANKHMLETLSGVPYWPWTHRRPVPGSNPLFFRFYCVLVVGRYMPMSVDFHAQSVFFFCKCQLKFYSCVVQIL